MADETAKAPLVDESGQGIELQEAQAPLRPANEGGEGGYDARDLLPTAPEPAGPPPDKVKLRGPNGENEEVKVTPTMMFCSDKPPPGGWYGPFGFLRMACYFFVGVAVAGVLLMLWGLFRSKGMVVAAQNLILIPAALLAAAAAYSHEGLANEVSKVAKANDKYASLNDEFEEQLKDLGDVATKLEDMVSSGKANLEKLEQVISGIEIVSDLGKVNTVVRSFTDAEMREFMNAQTQVTKRLSNVAELKAFLEGCVSVLKHNIPSFDFKNFRRFGLRGGVGLTTVSLIVAAVNTENQAEQHAFVETIFFILDPHGEKRLSKLSHHLVKHLAGNRQFGTKGKIEAEIQRLIDNVDPKEQRGRVQEKDCKELVLAILTTITDSVQQSKSVDMSFDDVSSDEE